MKSLGALMIMAGILGIVYTIIEPPPGVTPGSVGGGLGQLAQAAQANTGGSVPIPVIHGYTP